MPEVCLYVQVHQPYRLRRFRVFDIGGGGPYFDDEHNQRIVKRVAAKCYLPANRLLTRLIKESGGGFRIAMSTSGVLIEQLAATEPDLSAAEFRDRLGLACHPTTVWRALRRLDLTFKKK